MCTLVYFMCIVWRVHAWTECKIQTTLESGNNSTDVHHSQTQHTRTHTRHTTHTYTAQHTTLPADIQNRRTYSEVISYGLAVTHETKVTRDHDQSLHVSPLQKQQTAASFWKQPCPALSPVHQIRVSRRSSPRRRYYSAQCRVWADPFICIRGIFSKLALSLGIVPKDSAWQFSCGKARCEIS